MKALDAATEMLFDAAAADAPAGAPDARHLAPSTAEQAGEIMRAASDHDLRVLIWGGGTHQGIGYPVEPDLVVSTSRLTEVVQWEPDDLTVVVEAGVTVADLEAMLAEHRQTAVLPEVPGEATIGGVVAAGVSGWRRLRYGPTRDRVLETILATGDGRVVRAGGRLVKNVTGYDLPRLATGSLGSLGLITQVCLKLWPQGARFAGVAVADPDEARRIAYKPLAVIETEAGSTVYLSGTAEEIDAQARALGGEAIDDPRWPRPLDSPVRAALRVPAGLTSSAVERVRGLEGSRFRASHGVGEVLIGAVELPGDWVRATRQWAEAAGGCLVVTHGAAGIDPWGTPPASLALQRRVKAAFDPIGISNPGRLPGRL